MHYTYIRLYVENRGRYIIYSYYNFRHCCASIEFDFGSGQGPVVSLRFHILTASFLFWGMFVICLVLDVSFVLMLLCQNHMDTSAQIYDKGVNIFTYGQYKADRILYK